MTEATTKRRARSVTEVLADADYRRNFPLAAKSVLVEVSESGTTRLYDPPCEGFNGHYLSTPR